MTPEHATRERDRSTDVARVRAEEALRASEERYRTLFESIDQGFCVIEVLFDDAGNPLDYRFLEVNRVFEQQTGIASAVGRRMRDIAPAHEEHWFRIYGHVALTGEPLRFENPAAALGRHYDVYAFRIGKPEQRQVAILFSDITERKRKERERERLHAERARAEEARRASDERFRTLVEASSQVLYRMSPDWSEMWQLHSRAFLASTPTSSRTWLADYIPAEEQPLVLATITEAIRSKSVFALEHRVRRADGSIGWVSSRAIPIKDQSGAIVEWFGAASDITDRKRAAMAQALEEANQRLREADQRKNEFLAMLSHELRNPLAPIVTSLYVLDHAAPGGEQARRAQTVINRQVAHMTRLIDDLLDVTRITSGKIRLQPAQLDLCELSRRAVEDHRAAFKANGIDLQVTTPATAVWVYGDRTRLAQAIGNLLHNANKFTPRGGSTVVSIEVDDPRTQATIRVTDTGVGFTQELAPRLFQVLVQADTSLDRRQGGLGLGLALVRRLIELHGGSVAATSEGLGKGATFTITLPVGEDGPALEPRREDGRGASRRLLIIEDHEETARSLGEALQLGEHEVQICSSGREGIEKARAYRPAIILCDIGLPGMDGYEVSRTIRADPELSHIKLVAVTGYATADDITKAKQAGFDAHIAKPPNLDVLHRMMAMLERPEARDEGSSETS